MTLFPLWGGRRNLAAFFLRLNGRGAAIGSLGGEMLGLLLPVFGYAFPANPFFHRAYYCSSIFFVTSNPIHSDVLSSP